MNAVTIDPTTVTTFDAARIENGLALAALAIAAGRSAMARGDIERANLFADRADEYLRGIDSPNFPEPSPEWDALHDDLAPSSPDDIGEEHWPSRY